MALPSRVTLLEVGPREGFQLEPPTISTADKVRLITALAGTGLRSIEATSFVSPTRVPQMADAEALLAALPAVPDVDYTCLYLNPQGFNRAVRTSATVEPLLFLSASDTFSRRNMNRSTQETLDNIPAWVDTVEAAGRELREIGLMAAFGCNYEGDIPLEHVLQVLNASVDRVQARGHRIERIRLFDTMGWANPVQVERMVEAVWRRWPDMRLRLHFHDTRGLGMANVYAALRCGVTELEAAIGGLGGCPFAGHKGAAGNVPTEDVTFLCAELGIETGVRLPALVQCVALAEEIVGRTLPGKAGHASLRPERLA